MSFSIRFYNNVAEANRVDKTNYITLVDTLNGVLRETSSITSPTITIQKVGVPTFNYAYIPTFNRYYHIVDIISIRQNLWEISLEVDVLMSFKDAILQASGFIERNEFNVNPLLVDKKRVIEQGYDIETYEVENDVFVDYPETDTDSAADDIIGNELFYVLNGYKISSSHKTP